MGSVYEKEYVMRYFLIILTAIILVLQSSGQLMAENYDPEIDMMLRKLDAANAENPAEQSLTIKPDTEIAAENQNSETKAPTQQQMQQSEAENPTETQSAERPSDALGAEQPSQPQENDTAEPDKENEPEEELILEVFSPEFMASLQVCRPNSETKDNRTFSIIGIQNNKCRMTYGNYILNVPLSLLSSIHGFDDLKTFLKNKDMAKYKYLPEYTYEGLIYALRACANKEKYYGIEEEEKRVDALITRGLSAEYNEGNCTINLQNDLELDEGIFDYGVTCSLSEDVINELMPYFTDIFPKYKQIELTEIHKHKELRDADIALMYYLQQHEFCRRNNMFNN